MKNRNLSKRGRKNTDPILRFRTWIWYWAVRHKTEMLDGQLDLEFSPVDESGHKRVYADRIRIFEDIRKSGCSITEGNHSKRNFNLIDIVNARDDLRGSTDLYNSSFWGFITEHPPSLTSAAKQLEKMINTLELYKTSIQHIPVATTEELIEMSELINLSPEQLTEILKTKIPTEERKAIDELLYSFGGLRNYLSLLDRLDFKLLAEYFDYLSFLIAFYRYALFTGNFHAIVSAADYINEMLSLFIVKKSWLDSELSSAFAREIEIRIFNQNPCGKIGQITIKIDADFDRGDQSLAINIFTNKLNNQR